MDLNHESTENPGDRTGKEPSNLITRESYIISRGKVERVYEGSDDVSGHIILAPANVVELEMFDRDKRRLNGDEYAPDKIFRLDFPDLEDCKEQIESTYSGLVPIATISKGNASVLHPNGMGYVERNVGMFAYQDILDDWAFDHRLGDRKYFLQVAHVFGHDTNGALSLEDLTQFLTKNPLDSLVNRKRDHEPRRNNDPNSSNGVSGSRFDALNCGALEAFDDNQWY